MAEKATRMPTTEEASQVFLKSKQDQLGYLIQSTLRIEKGLATLTQNQEGLERIIEQKFYNLDLKVTEIQTVVEQLEEEVEKKKGKTTTYVFQRVQVQERQKATLSLEGYDLYIFLPLWQQVTKNFKYG